MMNHNRCAVAFNALQSILPTTSTLPRLHQDKTVDDLFGGAQDYDGEVKVTETSNQSQDKYAALM
jgi:hypothetical protein